MSRFYSAVLVALAMLAATAGTALAGSLPARLTLTAPAAAALGETVSVRARLVDGQGGPLRSARIAFVAPMSFLNGGGDVVLTEGITDKEGYAAGSFVVHVVGTLALRAVFRGDELYAAAEASAQQLAIEGGGGHSFYAEHAGVRLPGLNEPPGFGQVVLMAPQNSLLARMLGLWPAMSGWPIAGALVVIWSLYGSVVLLLFKIAGAKRSEAGPAEVAP